MSHDTEVKETSFAKTLSVLAHHYGYGVREIARFCGASAGTVSRLLQGENTNPTLGVVVKLADLFDVSIDELVGRKPVRLKESSRSKTIRAIKTIPIVTCEQLLSWYHSGQWRVKPQETIDTEIALSANALAFRMKTAQWSNIPEGAVVIVDPDCAVKSSDFVLILNRQEKSCYVRKVLLDEEDIVLKSPRPSENWNLLSKYETMIGPILQVKLDFD